MNRFKEEALAKKKAGDQRGKFLSTIVSLKYPRIHQITDIYGQNRRLIRIEKKEDAWERSRKNWRSDGPLGTAKTYDWE